MHAGNCAQIPSFPRKREPRDAGCCRRLWTPAFAQGCPGKVEEPFVRAFCSEFYLQKPLARARPGHPRLDATAISVKKTWVAGPSPATGIRSDWTGSWPRNPVRFPGQPCAFAGMTVTADA